MNLEHFHFSNEISLDLEKMDLEKCQDTIHGFICITTTSTSETLLLNRIDYGVVYYGTIGRNHHEE